mmetsp:Transcript_19469/g.44514  ORF Transcript_19469/g.44514 Transcript_19469/m.44514 type:complete len:89 (-) Transcript_19469:154-420(-)
MRGRHPIFFAGQPPGSLRCRLRYECGATAADHPPIPSVIEIAVRCAANDVLVGGTNVRQRGLYERIQVMPCCILGKKYAIRSLASYIF